MNQFIRREIETLFEQYATYCITYVIGKDNDRTKIDETRNSLRKILDNLSEKDQACANAHS